jgi:glycerol-3-phosphate dehydrogenase
MHSQQNNSKVLSGKYDVIVIGTGVVGCAMARQFTLEGASVLALEKGTDILDGASKANSAILHTGFDAPPNSLEHTCIVAGYQEYLNIRSKLKLPLLKTGALVTAWTQEEESLLAGILEKAHLNGVTDAKLLSANETFTVESNLSSKLKAAIHIPREYVIDPWTSPFVYMLQALENGAKLLRDTEVLSGEFDGIDWQINTSKGSVKGSTIINCAGLYGDRLDSLLIGRSSFEIRPRKGQFLVYDKAASQLIESIILPVPNEITKGVVVCRTAFGNILVGPTAEEQQSRDNASVTEDELRALKQKGEEIVPALADLPITATYAGIRPATQFKDYCIKAHQDEHYISVGGIRSTGLSSALGIAHHVFKQYQTFAESHTPASPLLWPTVSPIAEDEKRDWQVEGNEGIVCHCELVTKREIKQALGGAMPACSLEGLKRRTRVTMGRCQGFYCSAQLSEITQGCFKEPMTKALSQTRVKSIDE